MLKLGLLIFLIIASTVHSNEIIEVKLVHNSNVNDEDHDGAKVLKKILASFLYP